MEVEINTEALEYEFTSPEGFVATIMEKACIQVETTAKVLMSVPGSGRMYEPGKYVFYSWWNRKWYAWTRVLPPHRASAPGAPASSDSGRAASMIKHELVQGGEAIRGKVEIDVDYSVYFEMGTSLMHPRPTLRPALDSLRGMQF